MIYSFLLALREIETSLSLYALKRIDTILPKVDKAFPEVIGCFLQALREIETSSPKEMDSCLQALRGIDTSLLRRVDTSSLRWTPSLTGLKGGRLIPEGLKGERRLLLKGYGHLLPKDDRLLLQVSREIDTSLKQDRRHLPKVSRLLP